MFIFLEYHHISSRLKLTFFEQAQVTEDSVQSILTY